MALYQPGDTVPETGFYQCIFCRLVVRCTEGLPFPPCPSECKRPVYAIVKKNDDLFRAVPRDENGGPES